MPNETRALTGLSRQHRSHRDSSNRSGSLSGPRPPGEEPAARSGHLEDPIEGMSVCSGAQATLPVILRAAAVANVARGSFGAPHDGPP